MFERCCNNRSTNRYSIKHSTQPIRLSIEEDNAIKDFLWYVPTIESEQSKENKILTEELYDDICFAYIMDRMGMCENRDVMWLEKKEVDNADWNYYLNEICIICQKCILRYLSSYTKTSNLLREIRNCIAHGRFTFVGDYLLAFNLYQKKKRSIIKIRPTSLLEALQDLSHPNAFETIVRFAFKRLGYNVSNLYDDIGFDFLIEKKSKRYLIAIKERDGNKYLHAEVVYPQLETLKHMDDNVEMVLITNTSKARLTKELCKLEDENGRFRIVWKEQLEEMFGKDQVDVLSKENEKTEIIEEK